MPNDQDMPTPGEPIPSINRKGAPHRGLRTVPSNVVILRDRLGPKDAADRLGISQSNLFEVIRQNSAPLSVERLAKHLLKGTPEADRNRDRLLIIKVTPDQMAILKPLMDALRIRVAFADDA